MGGERSDEEDGIVARRLSHAVRTHVQHTCGNFATHVWNVHCARVLHTCRTRWHQGCFRQAPAAALTPLGMCNVVTSTPTYCRLYNTTQRQKLLYTNRQPKLGVCLCTHNNHLSHKYVHSTCPNPHITPYRSCTPPSLWCHHLDQTPDNGGRTSTVVMNEWTKKRRNEVTNE